ncbi:ALP1-like protein [Tanacetum coccineum]
MSDSTGGMTDLDDMDDIEMIMQQLKYEQESSHRCNYIYREREDAEESIENHIQTVDPLPLHFDFFRVRPDATGLPGFSVIMKCTSSIRQLAYSVTPDALDEYLKMGDHCARDCLDFFTMCVIQLFMPEYLRKPNFNDIQKLYNAHNNIHGFPRIIESIDCMHWEWKNYPKEWDGQFARVKAGLCIQLAVSVVLSALMEVVFQSLVRELAYVFDYGCAIRRSLTSESVCVDLSLRKLYGVVMVLLPYANLICTVRRVDGGSEDVDRFLQMSLFELCLSLRNGSVSRCACVECCLHEYSVLVWGVRRSSLRYCECGGAISFYSAQRDMRLQYNVRDDDLWRLLNLCDSCLMLWRNGVLELESCARLWCGISMTVAGISVARVDALSEVRSFDGVNSRRAARMMRCQRACGPCL